jgi:hypothetical protein
VIDGTMSDPNHPGLSCGILLKQAISCRHDIFIDLEAGAFEVDRLSSAEADNLWILTIHLVLPLQRLVRLLTALTIGDFSSIQVPDCNA